MPQTLWLAFSLFFITSLLSNHSLSFTEHSSIDLKSLSSNITWKRLLGYNNLSNSSIINHDFFLHPQGNSKPLKELEATLKAFQQPHRKIDINSHPQCQYPARYLWLQRYMDFSKLGIKKQACPDYDHFSLNEESESISLIFATGYLGNPASYYGHLLFKINSSKNEKKIDDTAINYGARIPDNENMVLYIVKGITGHYESTFSRQKFYYHLHNYSDNEKRDLWEYRLNLTKDDREFLIAHTWEMLNAKHNYYFFNRNCAYRMAELIELISDQELSNELKPWEAPHAILTKLEKATNNGTKIIAAVNYIPSRQTRLYQKFSQLTKTEKSVVQLTANNLNTLDTSTFNTLDNTAKVKVLNTLTDYYQYILPIDEVKHSTQYNTVLNKRFSLPMKTVNFNDSRPTAPHKDHKLSYSSIGIKNNQQLGEAMTFRLRPAYYDHLDAGASHISGSALSMLDIQFSQYKDHSEIDSLDMIRIENIYSDSTRLPGDKPQAWSLRLGAKKLNNKCLDCLAYVAEAGRGLAFWLTDKKLLINPMIQLGASGRNTSDENLYLGTRIRLSYKLSDNIQTSIATEHNTFFNTSTEQSSIIFNSRYQISNNQDVRLQFKHDSSNEITLSSGLYW